MKIININSFSIKEVIRDIASTWEGTHGQDWEKYTLKIPSSWGSGEISGYDLNDGMGLLQYDCLFHDDVQLHFMKRPVHPLVLNYCLSGELEVFFEDMDDFTTVEQYQSLIMVNQDDKGYILQFKKHKEIKARSVEIDRQDFRKSFYLDDHTVEPHYRYLFDIVENVDSFYHNHMYSVLLSDYFDQIDESSLEGLVRALYVKGVVLQIISEQLNLYLDDLKDDGVQGILRQYEISCIHEAAQIINDELAELESIPHIAHRVGLNCNKLQDGFKLLYQSTVNGYVQDVRMKRAAYLLHYSDYAISEIVTKLGLNSKSYFSKIFKTKYAITPSDYRRKKLDRVSS